MQTFSRRTKVLITVKTYPHPSKGYRELVCTAGITESKEWVRLYPVDYRYMPVVQQYEKYQWIEVDLKKADPKKDNRKESFRPNLETIQVLGEPISTKHKWRERREIIDDVPCHTLKQLQGLWDQDKTSLGIIRPKRILDLEIKKTDSEWKGRWKTLFQQNLLFGERQKPLRKLPFDFRYIFECEDDNKPHKIMCEDWELGTLFFKERERLASEDAAAESVRNKFLGELCREDKDTRFFMGTRFPYNTWLVLGVFWPPKIAQKTLF